MGEGAGVGVNVGVTVGVAVGVAMGVGVLKVRICIARQGLTNQIPSKNTTARTAPSSGAGGTIDTETWGKKLRPVSKDAPHIRHVLAPSATLALQAGQRLTSFFSCTLNPQAGHRPRPPRKVAPQFGHFIMNFSWVEFRVLNYAIIPEFIDPGNKP